MKNRLYALVIVLLSVFPMYAMREMQVVHKNHEIKVAGSSLLYRTITNSNKVSPKKFKEQWEGARLLEKKAIVALLKGKGETNGECTHCYSNPSLFTIFSIIHEQHPKFAGDFPPLTDTLFISLLHQKNPIMLSQAIVSTSADVLGKIWGDNKNIIESRKKLYKAEQKKINQKSQGSNIVKRQVSKRKLDKGARRKSVSSPRKKRKKKNAQKEMIDALDKMEKMVDLKKKIALIKQAHK